MSGRQKVGIGILAVMAGILLIGVIGVFFLMQSFRGLGDFSGYGLYGLLGPEGQRQRIEVPAHGFAVSFAGNWTVETLPPDPAQAQRLGVIVVLTSTPPEEGPVCTVLVAPGAATEPDGQVLRPWFEAQGFGDSENTSAWDTSAWDTSDGTSWDIPEGTAGLSSLDDTGRLIAAWLVPHRDDALALSCVIAGYTSDDEYEYSFMPEHWWLWGLPPIVDSFESLPKEG